MDVVHNGTVHNVVHNVPSISVDVLRLILKRQGDQPNFVALDLRCQKF